MDSVDGLILVDKPKHLTSNEVTVFVKRMSGAGRAGHVGTLDPNVSGVLPVAVGRSTKLIRFISGFDKTYVCAVKFEKEITKKQFCDAARQWEGVITQTPPKQSAVARRPRKRKVHYIHFLDMIKSKHVVLFETKVEAGTYIRVLCKDLGRTLGTNAEMIDLRRIRAGVFEEEQCWTLNEVNYAFHELSNGNPSYVEKVLLPPNKFLGFLNEVVIRKSAAKSLLSGAQLMRPGIVDAQEFNAGDYVRVVLEDKTFVGVGRAVVDWKDVKSKSRGLVIKMMRVHITPDKL